LRYFARLSSRVTESGSLALCAAYFLSLPSDPAVAGNALAIWIVFPLVGVTSRYSGLGLLATLGEQQSRAIADPALLTTENYTR
jgi:hypothetical protein